MAIREKVSPEEMALYEIIRHPVLFGEFIQNMEVSDQENEFEFDYYQKEFLCDYSSHVSIRAGRSVGKTEGLTNLILWILVYNLFPQNYIIYTVPNKVHLEPVWKRLTRLLRTNSLLKNFIKAKEGINSSTNTATLLNGATLICRIAGQSGDGTNVIGLHTPFIILDETGYYPWGTYLELLPTLNNWQRGFRFIVSGVPTGLRERNVCWHADQENENFKKHRISAYENPRFGPTQEKAAIEQFGGKLTEDFAHFVYGKHGSPVFSVFDRRNMTIETDPIYKLSIDGIRMEGGIEEYFKKIAILPMPPKNNGVILGADLGYTEPTAIFIMYLDNKARLRFHAKIRLSKVPYDIQEQFLDLLDTKFNPVIIGIDEGHSGLGVTQRMMNSKEYQDKRYDKRMQPINFASNIIIGEDKDGNEIKSRTKPFSVSVLQDYSDKGKVIYSSTDPEIITELERMTYRQNPVTGDISYRTLTERGGKRGADHFTAALLCGVLAYHLEEQMIIGRRSKRKLAGARWSV